MAVENPTIAFDKAPILISDDSAKTLAPSDIGRPNMPDHTRGRLTEENYNSLLPAWGPGADLLSRTYPLAADVYGVAHCGELPLVFDNLDR
ncbi:hypothetical protein MY11210_005488 [Beauveria gryllotalpidicola]